MGRSGSGHTCGTAYPLEHSTKTEASDRASDNRVGTINSIGWAAAEFGSMSIPYLSLVIARVGLKRRKEAIMVKTLCDGAMLCNEENSHNF
jgi:hypothetical protein